MLQIAGYRLPFHSTHVVCPVCTSASGNPCSISVQPVQPCCFYPAELCPELPVQLPGSSVMALPKSSFRPYGIAVKPRNTLPVSYRHIQPLQNENATRSQAEGNDGISGVTSNSDSTEVSRPHRCTAAAVTKRKRRKRTIFTSEQLTRLESEFEEQQYMVGTERQHLAEALNLSETQIKIWFQNRRIKWRKENKQNYPDFLASPFAVAYAFRHAEESWNDQCGLRSCNDCQEK